MLADGPELIHADHSEVDVHVPVAEEEQDDELEEARGTEWKADTHSQEGVECEEYEDFEVYYKYHGSSNNRGS